MASRGQIQIDVVADTSKVPKQIEQKLKAALKNLKIPPVAVDGDTEPFLKKVKQTQKDTEKSFQGFMSRLKNRLTSDSDSLGSAIGSSLKSGISSAMQSASKTASSAAATLGTTLGVAVIAALAPVVIGGISSVITVAAALGAGAAIIGIGALALKENEKLVAQAKSTVDTIKKVFTEAAQPLIEPFSEALTEVRSLFKSLAPDLKGLFAGITPSVRALTSALGPTLKPILEGLKKSLPGINAAFAGLAKGLVILGTSIGKFFTTIFKDGPVVQAMTKNLFAFAAALLDVLGPAIRVTSVLFSAFVNLGRASAIGWTIAWEQIKKAFDGGTGAINRLTTAWAPLKQAIMAVWDALKRFAAADTEAELAVSMTELVQKIKDAWGPLKGFLGVAWDEAWAFIQRVWAEKVVPWWEGTVKPYLTDQIKSFVANTFSSMVDEAVGFLASLPGRAAGALATLGSSIREKVLGAVAGAANWLFDAGTKIVQGLIDGVLDRIGSLASAASRLGQIIRDNKGPESYDRVMLKPAGQMIVQGLMAGMSSQEEQLRRQVAGITSSMTMAGTSGAVRGGDGAQLETGGVRVWPSQPSGADAVTTLAIESVGQDRFVALLIELLQYGIRTRGGNVQKVLGKSAGGVR